VVSTIIENIFCKNMAKKLEKTLKTFLYLGVANSNIKGEILVLSSALRTQIFFLNPECNEY